MEPLQRIALLIDCDNTPSCKIEGILEEVAKLGTVVLKRAYGNWKKDTRKLWETQLLRFGIKAEQQFDYVAGKNATDIALVIDAMTLLHRGLYDGFVIVSSDSDYTPLAIHLRESGAYVIGAGQNYSSEAFQNSCNTFIFLDSLGDSTPSEPPHSPSESLSTTPCENPGTASIEQVHAVLKTAWEKHKDQAGYASICSAGQVLGSAFANFHIKAYGYPNLTTLIAAFPGKYRLKASQGKGGAMIRSYQCIQNAVDSTPSPKTTAQQQAVIAHLSGHHHATRAELESLLSLKSSRTSAIIKSLLDAGLILAEGSHNNRTYRLKA